jgi:endonuclease YncB( thermonuclease family)
MLILFLCLTLATDAWSEEFTGKVVGVADGDTITVLRWFEEKDTRSSVKGYKQVKVRLAQIDAPEKSQAFGQTSKQSLSDLVFGKQVRVVQETVDRYGRIVGRVYVNDMDVNAEQVSKGMAWVYV